MFCPRSLAAKFPAVSQRLSFQQRHPLAGVQNGGPSLRSSGRRSALHRQAPLSRATSELLGAQGLGFRARSSHHLGAAACADDPWQARQEPPLAEQQVQRCLFHHHASKPNQMRSPASTPSHAWAPGQRPKRAQLLARPLPPVSAPTTHLLTAWAAQPRLFLEPDADAVAYASTPCAKATVPSLTRQCGVGSTSSCSPQPRRGRGACPGATPAALISSRGAGSHPHWRPRRAAPTPTAASAVRGAAGLQQRWLA